MREQFGFEPKDFQIAAVKAQIEGVDMILQASTGAGKTAIAAGPHLWPGNEKKFTIMTCPLLSLEEEMVQTFQNEYGLTAIALNSKNGGCEPEKLKDILALKYQIILISPEMLQSRSFHNRVLRNTTFMRNMISMFIDEAHCIVHWGAEFRKKYGTLGKLRVFFPRGTPVIAVSATLTPRVVRAIYRSLYFTQSDAQWRFVNKGNDRANVSLVVRACEHPLNSYADLDFVIPSSIRNPVDIPKTYIYVDNIAMGAEIIDYLNALIRTTIAKETQLSRKAKKRFRGVVRPFNATMSSSYRTRAMDQFRAGRVRILVCTDAAGMGCNVPDVDHVVQWKLPATFSHWIQRAGRAARGPGRTGLAVLLVERSAYNVDLLNPTSQTAGPGPGTKPSKTKKSRVMQDPTSESTTPKRDPKQVREYALAHGLAWGASSKADQLPTGEQPPVHEEDADEGLHAHVQSTSCRRKAWAVAFDSGPAAPTVPCCDICDPTLLDLTRPCVPVSEKRSKALKRGQLDLDAREKLSEWREATYVHHHHHAQYDDMGVLQDELLDTLVSHGPLLPDQVTAMLKDKWVFWERHGTVLSALVQSLNIKFTPLPPKPRRSAKKVAANPPPQPRTPPPEEENPCVGRMPAATPSFPATFAPASHPRTVEVPSRAEVNLPFHQVPTHIAAGYTHRAEHPAPPSRPPTLFHPSSEQLPPAVSSPQYPPSIVPSYPPEQHHPVFQHPPAAAQWRSGSALSNHFDAHIPSTSQQHSYRQSFHVEDNHQHYIQPGGHHHPAAATAMHHTTGSESDSVPWQEPTHIAYSDRIPEYHPNYSYSHTDYPTQVQEVPIVSQPDWSGMQPSQLSAPAAPQMPPNPPPLLSTNPNDYFSHTTTQFYISQYGHDTTYDSNPVPSSSTPHVHGDPPEQIPQTGPPPHDYNDFYYPTTTEQFEYMEY